MKLTYKLEKEEYLEALKLHHKRGFRNVMMAIYVGFAIFFILFTTDFSNTQEVVLNLSVLFVALSSYIVLTKLISGSQSKKIYDKTPALSNEATLRITAKGIKLDEQSKFIPWESFRKYKENEKYYILYTSIRTFQIIPKKAMTDGEHKEFRGYLEKSIHRM